MEKGYQAYTNADRRGTARRAKSRLKKDTAGKTNTTANKKPDRVSNKASNRTGNTTGRTGNRAGSAAGRTANGARSNVGRKENGTGNTAGRTRNRTRNTADRTKHVGNRAAGRAKNRRMEVQDYMIYRVTFMFFGFFLAFVFLAFTIYHVIAENQEKYQKKALAQQTYISNEIPYRRGEIQDRNGTVFARSKTVYNLIISPKEILAVYEKGKEKKQKWKEPALSALETYFGYAREDIETILEAHKESQYYCLQRQMEEEPVEIYKQAKKEEEQAIKDRNKKRGKEEEKEEFIDLGNCIYFELNYKRVYPLETTASNVIGFATDVSKYGVENYYNKQLSGTSGRNYGYFNSYGELERTVKPAEDGYTVVTTLDANVQQIVEKRINKFQKKGIGAKRVAVVLSNPQNGEIYAMASSTNFYDLNNPSNLSRYYTENQIKKMSEKEYADNCNEMWRNYCVSDAYEPGSTFKPYTVAAVLEEAKATNKSTYVCDGYQNIQNWPKPVKCTHIHGKISIAESIMLSCNDALMQMGATLGRSTFYRYERNFGLGQRTGIDLPGESAGILLTVDKLTPVDLATSSFGQSNTVTMVQMAAGFSSIINGGNYYVPHIMKRIVDNNGAIVETYPVEAVRKTVSEKTSGLLKKYLFQAVESDVGTAVGARVRGYEIGGKTGTAEKHPRGKGNYLLSFLGYVGYDEPELVVYVIIDEPNVEDQAHSSFATTFAADILEDVLPFLGIYREGGAGSAGQQGESSAEDDKEREGDDTEDTNDTEDGRTEEGNDTEDGGTEDKKNKGAKSHKDTPNEGEKSGNNVDDDEDSEGTVGDETDLYDNGSDSGLPPLEGE